MVLDSADEKAVIETLRSKLLFRYDHRALHDTPVGQFERLAELTFNAKYALAVSSGTTALSLALMSLNVGPGDQVGIPGFAFAATPSAVLLAGARPVLIEIDEDLNLDLKDLKRKFTPKMKALIVVHMRGSASDMAEIMDFADSWGLKVVEDAVPAMGVKYRGRCVGSWGHCGVFSTQSDKSCNTGEGGLLLCQDALTFRKAIVLSGAYEDRWRAHLPDLDGDFLDADLPLYNFRMDNLRGALAFSQLIKLPLRLERLSKNYSYLLHQLASLKRMDIRKSLEPDSILGDSLVFRLQECDLDHTVWFCRALRAEGIECSAFGDPSAHNIRAFWNWGFLFPGVDLATRKRLLPQTARYLEQTVDIPLSPLLEMRDLDDLIAAVRKVLNRTGRLD